MKLADAYKIGSSVVGYVKCTYAMIYDENWIKVWSYQRKNLKHAKISSVDYQDYFCTPVGEAKLGGGRGKRPVQYIPVQLTQGAISAILAAKAKKDQRFADRDMFGTFYVKESAVDWIPKNIENIVISDGSSLKETMEEAQAEMQKSKNMLYLAGASNVLGVLALSVPATAAAFVKYKKAKSEYESAKEQYDGIYSTIMTYNQKIRDYQAGLEIAKNQETYETVFPDGVHISTMLRVGNLAKAAGVVGQLFRVQASVVLTNTSSNTYKIHKIATDCHVLDTDVYVHKIKLSGDTRATQEKYVSVTLNPGETVEIKMPGGVTTLGEEKDDELRKIICEACGKRLITSCPKTSIEDIETADVLFDWSKVGGAEHTCKAADRPGILRYCGEAFYPQD